MHSPTRYRSIRWKPFRWSKAFLAWRSETVKGQHGKRMLTAGTTRPQSCTTSQHSKQPRQTSRGEKRNCTKSREGTTKDCSAFHRCMISKTRLIPYQECRASGKRETYAHRRNDPPAVLYHKPAQQAAKADLARRECGKLYKKSRGYNKGLLGLPSVHDQQDETYSLSGEILHAVRERGLQADYPQAGLASVSVEEEEVDQKQRLTICVSCETDQEHVPRRRNRHDFAGLDRWCRTQPRPVPAAQNGRSCTQ
jgi:hypothetical protein